MFTISGIIAFILVFIGVALWQSTARARELANRVSKKMCEKHDVQFLDGTTIQDRWRWCRGDSGKLGFMRHFHFNFYNGQHRLKGNVTIFHNEVTELYLENPLPDVEVKQADLFKPANEVSNVIQFPSRSKKDKD